MAKKKDEIEPEDQCPVARPKVICICGSRRFIEHMAVKAFELERKGNIVMAPALLPSWYSADVRDTIEANKLKETLCEVWFHKIDLSDEVLVINTDGYIGESTQAEIDYALEIGLPVVYEEELPKR